MRKFIVIFLFIISGTVIFAQLENIPLITVQGEGTIQVKPDYIVLGFKVYKSMPTNSNGDPIGFEIFKDEDTRIKLFDFNEKDIDESLIQLEGLKYVKEVYISIYDLDKLNRILIELNKLGFSAFHYMDYRVKDFEMYKNQARIKAIKSAKEKASQLVGELGQQIGKAHTIEEIHFQDYNWYNKNEDIRIEDIPFRSDADTYLLEPGFIVITSKIKVSFDLIK